MSERIRSYENLNTLLGAAIFASSILLSSTPSRGNEDVDKDFTSAINYQVTLESLVKYACGAIPDTTPTTLGFRAACKSAGQHFIAAARATQGASCSKSRLTVTAVSMIQDMCSAVHPPQDGSVDKGGVTWAFARLHCLSESADFLRAQKQSVSQRGIPSSLYSLTESDANGEIWYNNAGENEGYDDISAIPNVTGAEAQAGKAKSWKWFKPDQAQQNLLAYFSKMQDEMQATLDTSDFEKAGRQGKTPSYELCDSFERAQAASLYPGLAGSAPAQSSDTQGSEKAETATQPASPVGAKKAGQLP